MHYDIVIIGAGPVGLSFARSLSDTDLRVLLIERCSEQLVAEPSIDGRDIALTHLSMKLLKQMGVLARIQQQSISPIRAAKVINGNSSYSLNIDNKDDSISALGYLIANYRIRKALYDEVAEFGKIDTLYETSVTRINELGTHSEVTLSNGKIINCNLTVAADSRFSDTRRTQGISTKMLDFGRVVIVSRMQHEIPHDGTAFECFLYGRTLAVLPLSANLSSIVVTISADQADDIVQMSAEDFSKQVMVWFRERLGKMQLVGERHSYPLVAVHANQFVKKRYALLGDAAVGMHPVTAHGFNLGLRGQDTLSKEISAARLERADIGALSVLQSYETKHMRITKPLYHGTNEIVGLFTNDSPPAKLARNALLRFSNNFPPIKQMITHKLTEANNANGIPFPTFLI